MSVLAVAAVQVLLLCWARWFGVLLLAPMLAVVTGGRHWALAAVLAAVLAAADATTAVGLPPVDASSLVFAMLAELALGATVGVIIGWAATAIVGASATAATILRVPSAPWLLLVGAMVLGAALQLELHHAAFRASAALRLAFPIGDPSTWLGVVDDGELVVAWGGGMTALALALATPAVLVAAICDLVSAAIARGPGAASALAAASGSSLRLAAVLVALAASWSIDLPRWAAHAVSTAPAVAPSAVDASR